MQLQISKISQVCGQRSQRLAAATPQAPQRNCINVVSPWYQRQVAPSQQNSIKRRSTLKQQQRGVVCRATVAAAEPGKTTLGFCGIGIMGLPMVSRRRCSVRRTVTLGYCALSANSNRNRTCPAHHTGPKPDQGGLQGGRLEPFS